MWQHKTNGIPANIKHITKNTDAINSKTARIKSLIALAFYFISNNVLFTLEWQTTKTWNVPNNLISVLLCSNQWLKIPNKRRLTCSQVADKSIADAMFTFTVEIKLVPFAKWINKLGPSLWPAPWRGRIFNTKFCHVMFTVYFAS